MARLKRIWWCNTISFASKFKLYKSLVTSTLPYGSERSIPLVDTEKKVSRLSKPVTYGNLSASPTWSTKPMTGSGARSTSLLVHRNLF